MTTTKFPSDCWVPLDDVDGVPRFDLTSPLTGLCGVAVLYSVSSFLLVLLYLNIITLSSQNRLIPPWTLCWDIKTAGIKNKKYIKKNKDSAPVTIHPSIHPSIHPLSSQQCCIPWQREPPHGRMCEWSCQYSSLFNATTDITFCLCGWSIRAPTHMCRISRGDAEHDDLDRTRVSVGFCFFDF